MTFSRRLSALVCRPSALRRGLVAFVLFCATAATSTTAQERKVPFGEGTHTLRAILKQKFKIDPVGTERDIPAQRMLIVILGDTGKFIHWEALSERVREGAAVLIATDQHTTAPISSLMRIEVTGEFLQVPPMSATAYCGLADCPIVSDFEWDHPIFRTIKRIATNRPSSLRRGRPLSLRMLAWFPADTHWERQIDTGELRARQYPFAAGQSLGEGKILALSDHSVFINDMMLQTDNDNFFFACNCIDWLSDGGKRDRVAFFEDGQRINDFNVTFREGVAPPMPSEGDVINFMNQGLAELDDRDFFNQQLNRAIQNQAARRSRFPVDDEMKAALGRDYLLRAAVVALSVILGIFAFVRLVRVRESIDPLDPSLALALPVDAPAESITMRRSRALFSQDNHWETARLLARQCLESAGADPGEQQAPPPITATGSWWERYRWRARVSRLWWLASSEAPRRISTRQLRRLMSDIENVQQGRANGKWSISHVGRDTIPAKV